ncbi:RND family efflux transporter, MFP subunit [Pseudoxanthobacter soli DSM 19599]|uniref:RND family efflux transporter, MFP subunit n=1 Tax=Pseudoxanthobacter soli DSM 19599 TaxID=1123029 RepID=A0A1M7Z9Y2_9HYPH|nr:HlyD family secretion protein [Pseudoxanthobacter soli]SHO61619.1 RND family efflux transporter, MFP subunit [Pseudoxanthobacter soli DSM 19599]
MSAVEASGSRASRLRGLLPFVFTLVALGIAGFLGWKMWQAYMATPWTRDGTVRAYVVTVTPQVSGRIVDLAVKADQFVHKGDLLMEIEPADYQNALADAEAAVARAKADFDNKQLQAQRRAELTSVAVSKEEQQTFAAAADMAGAVYRQAVATSDQAALNLSRTRIVSPVDGYVTNLLIQPGDYARSGQSALSVVDSNSFWVDGYFEETALRTIRIGQPATVSLMAYPETLKGRVEGIGRGITVPNAQADASGLATVNPVFTWVRLAQRVPVRIALDDVPPSITLAAGLTATVTVDAGSAVETQAVDVADDER